MSETNSIGDPQPQRPWASPRMAPVKGIVQPRVVPPFGKPVRHTNKLDFIMNTVLKEASKHKHVWPFQKPVDAVTLCIPLYHEKITRAMDLKTIETRLRNVYYTCAQECVDDIETVFNNCYVFNGKEDDVTIMAQNVHEVIKKALENGPREEHDMEVTWGKNRKKAKTGGGGSSGGGGKRDARGPSEVPSEAGSETSAKGDRNKGVKKPGKRKADDDDDVVSDNKPETPRVKREVTTTKPVVHQPILPAIKPCLKLLNEFTSKKHTDINWPFLKPVDVNFYGLVDYHSIIKRPMDLGTMRTKLEQGAYKEPADFEADIRLMLANCFLYNPPGDSVHVCGQNFERVFDKRWAELMDSTTTTSRASSVAPTASFSGSSTAVSAAPNKPTRAAALKEPKKEPKSVDFVVSSTGSKSEDMMQIKNALAMVREREEKLKKELETLSLMRERLVNVKSRREENPNEPFPEKLLTDARTMCLPSAPTHNSSQTPLAGSYKNGKGGKRGVPARGYDFDSEDEESSKPMSYDEKRNLSMSINKLAPTHLSTIISVIQRREDSSLGKTQDQADSEIEIDFESLGDLCLREMEAFVKSVMSVKKEYGGGGELPKQYRTDPSPPSALKNSSSSSVPSAVAPIGTAAATAMTTTTTTTSSGAPMSDSMPTSAAAAAGAGAGGGKDGKKMIAEKSFNMSESSDDETSNSRKRRKKVQRAASSDSDSSSTSDDDSDDDQIKNVPRKSGQPPSAAWNQSAPPPRVAGMGGQPPMARVPPPSGGATGGASGATGAAGAASGSAGKSSSSFHPPSRIATKPPSSKPQTQKKEAKKSILDTLLPDSFGASSSSTSGSTLQGPSDSLPSIDTNGGPGMIGEDGENEADRIHRMRMEAKRAREREDENSVTLTNQMEMMSQFEYNNMY